MTELNRRSFLASTAAASLPLLTTLPSCRGQSMGGPGGGPLAISSANGMRAVTKAVLRLDLGADPADAAVAGVSIVESDPEDMTVGYGGLPNEDGVVQLDACVMHGPTHRAGAVAALENIRNPSQVALHVMRRTDHVLLVGDGALKFARLMGFAEENLLTDKAREIWLRWKRNLNPKDDWLDDEQHLDADASTSHPTATGPAFTHGTIHCSVLDARGDLAACTTTSGLSFKLPGRVGDSPIVGAGLYVDNGIGAAGATGRGEAVMQSCGTFRIVQAMAGGIEPTSACLDALKWIVDHTRRRMLFNERGEPKFNVTFYALRKDGVYGGAAIYQGGKFAVHDGTAARLVDCAYLYERVLPEEKRGR